jgi:ribonucleoside-diphosphate reductase alpha subunit
MTDLTYVTKRNGNKEEVSFDKITERIKRLIMKDENLNPRLIAMKVIPMLVNDISTTELDILSADICMNLTTENPNYAYLGGRILVSNLHKKTLSNFSDTTKFLYDNNLICKSYYDYVIANKDTLNNIISYDYDYNYDYFGFKTLEKAYLLKVNNTIIERPQDMLLRVAITLQQGNIDNIMSTYIMMAKGQYTHASPTLFNAGTNHMQLSSCFLLGTKDDLSSITHTWDSCAMISKWAGGIGLSISSIRGKNSIIKGTNGNSNGIVPFLKVFNEIARWIDQGGKRPGSIAVYLEPHHPDIFEFLDLRKNFGSETERARDLFLALWISDLFMKQVENDSDWYLMSSNTCPGLEDVYGDAYDNLYWSYVKENKYSMKIPARKLWNAILEAQIETGMPYINFKDNVNHKSNQKNIGIIRCSNLCSEIVQYSDDKEYAVCNLASISLTKFVEKYKFDMDTNKMEFVVYTKENCKYCTYAKNYLSNNMITIKEIPYSEDNNSTLKVLLKDKNITYPQIFLNRGNQCEYIGGWSDLYKKTAGTFNFDELYKISYEATVNLNNVIDINYYPVPETKLSNMKHRPIGLGIQGLADALVLMRIPFDSDEAIEFNAHMMETIYLASVTASNDMARSRYEGMKELISISTDFTLPEYYDRNIVIADSNLNNIYHMMKPCKYELNKNIDSMTIGAYSTFDGSPMSQGLFQFDMWKLDNNKLKYREKWDTLRESVMKYGTRNSMLTALMPTASTSQILGNNECFEFFTNNIYSRKTQAGTFVMVCKYLVDDMIKVGLWSKEIKDHIIAMNGSIQNIDVPAEFKALYKTIWEIKQSWVLKAAAARGPFVDQTQSMNIFMGEPDYMRLSSSHFWGWKNGLKTGMYYLRTKPSSDAIKFTIDPKLLKSVVETSSDCLNCSA